jgi:hypothetical protein
MGKAMVSAVVVLLCVILVCTAYKVSPQSVDAPSLLVILEPPATARILCCRVVLLGELGYLATGSRQYLDGRSRGWAVRLNLRGERVWEKQWYVGSSALAGLTDVVSSGGGLAYLVGSVGLDQGVSGTLTVAAVLKIDAGGELSRPLLNLAERGGRASYPQFTARRGIPT